MDEGCSFVFTENLDEQIFPSLVRQTSTSSEYSRKKHEVVLNCHFLKNGTRNSQVYERKRNSEVYENTFVVEDIDDETEPDVACRVNVNLKLWDCVYHIVFAILQTPIFQAELLQQVKPKNKKNPDHAGNIVDNIVQPCIADLRKLSEDEWLQKHRTTLKNHFQLLHRGNSLEWKLTLHQALIRNNDIIDVQIYGPQQVNFYGCSAASDSCSDLVQMCNEGFINGFYPQLISEGTGGTYYMYSGIGEIAACFKPRDEEQHAPNNPKGHVNSLGSKSMSRHILSGELSIREAGAYILDSNHSFHDVPKTVQIEVRDEDRKFFNYNSRKKDGKQITRKVGSLQRFVECQYSNTADLSNGMYPIREVHKIGILDLRLLNCDRNDENILVTKNSETSRLCFIPIDHGLCFPERLRHIGWNDWCWYTWSQAKEPFDPFTKQFIDQIDMEEDIRQLSELNLSAVCLDNIRISTMVLKIGTSYGLTLFDMASIIVRTDLEKPSEIELICAQAETLALNVLDKINWQERYKTSMQRSISPARFRGGNHSLSPTMSPSPSSRSRWFSSLADDEKHDMIEFIHQSMVVAQNLEITIEMTTKHFQLPENCIREMVQYMEESQETTNTNQENNKSSALELPTVGQSDEEDVREFIPTPSMSREFSLNYDAITKLTESGPSLADYLSQDSWNVPMMTRAQSCIDLLREETPYGLVADENQKGRQGIAGLAGQRGNFDGLHAADIHSLEKMLTKKIECQGPRERSLSPINNTPPHMRQSFSLPFTAFPSLQPHMRVSSLPVSAVVTPRLPDLHNMSTPYEDEDQSLTSAIDRFARSSQDVRCVFFSYIKKLLELKCIQIISSKKKAKAVEEEDDMFRSDTVEGAFVWKNGLRPTDRSSSFRSFGPRKKRQDYAALNSLLYT